MNGTLEKAKRPISITVISLLMFTGAIVLIPSSFLQIAQNPSLLAICMGSISVLGLVCAVGLWMMKKWAAYTYTTVAVLVQVIFLFVGVLDFRTLVVTAVIIWFLLKNAPKMT